MSASKTPSNSWAQVLTVAANANARQVRGVISPDDDSEQGKHPGKAGTGDGENHNGLRAGEHIERRIGFDLTRAMKRDIEDKIKELRALEKKGYTDHGDKLVVKALEALLAVHFHYISQ